MPKMFFLKDETDGRIPAFCADIKAKLETAYQLARIADSLEKIANPPHIYDPKKLEKDIKK